ncbi:MAG: hypothetical protein H6Q68_1657 [Firmicutes bacterium]|nr:hypothetical protein [Bacillota bacterium]
MKKTFTNLAIIAGILFSIYSTTYASWGWESTDDPTPYYHQEWGKWYNYEDAKVFMVQIDDKTYKYVFDYNGKFIGGWITYMPMRL